MENKLYAFWRYDRPPYLLCGEVVEIKEDGSIRVKGYGSACFTKESVVKIVPIEKGIKLEKKLKKAMYKYKVAVSTAENALRKVVKDISQ